ncbi:MYND Zn-finger protein [Ceratobasidium sp. AG-Ba]|nr:MYND Zn-finger protein [Ceratobasidium sp. AG-Ba]
MDRRSAGRRAVDPFWGPELDPHSFTFEPTPPIISEPDPDANRYRSYDVIALRNIMGHLIIGGLGKNYTGKTVRFDHLVLNCIQYASALGLPVEDIRVTRFYYGFSAVRHIVQTTCINIMREIGPADAIEKVLDFAGDWNRMANRIAQSALDLANEAWKSVRSRNKLFAIFSGPRFTESRAIGAEFATELGQMLWMDRGTILTFYTRGLLPGCPLLLLALLNQILAEPKQETLKLSLLHLQDLGCRLYLVAPPEEQRILQHVCTTTADHAGIWDVGTSRFFSVEDSHTIHRTFSEMVLSWQQNTRTTKDLPIEFIFYLVSLVQNAISSNPSATDDERIDILRLSVRTLWTIFEHRRHIALDDHGIVRAYMASSVFLFLGGPVQLRISEASKTKLAEAFVEEEIVGLTGRVVLLLTDRDPGENSEQYQLEGLFPLVEGMSVLPKALRELIPLVEDGFREAGIEWAKVFNRIIAWFEYKRQTARLSVQFAQQLQNLMSTWVNMSDSVNFGANPVMCMYTRCCGKSTQEDALRVQYTCGRCYKAIYCDSVCQQAHWALGTSDAHCLLCKSSTGQTAEKTN